MLTKVRIEVEEQTVGETVDALARYEHAIVTAEAQRYIDQWPTWYEVDPEAGGEPKEVDPRNVQSFWEMPAEDRDYFREELGAELLEQVIEYDQSIPAWKGRVVYAYRRVDMRSNHFRPLEVISPSPTAASSERTSVKITHGTMFPK